MTIISTGADVPADQAAVWDLLSDPAQTARWQTTHVRYGGEPPAAFTTGASFVEQLRVMGMPAEVTWTVTEVNAPARLALTGRGPMGITLHSSFEIEPAGTGSRVLLAQEFTGAAITAVAGPLEREVKGAQEKSLTKLAEAVRS